MFVKLLKSKLHRATVTDTKLHYPGSIAIDSRLIEAAGYLPYEFVLIADLNNGNRLETYVVPAEADSGRITILGAAAHLIKPKDLIIVFSFGYYTPEEAKKHKPKIIVLDENNKINKRYSMLDT
ncbi:MAG: aspartate 1-decarboxylase [Planctomycetes bacterium RBG_13_44_8b]|nr:MAG: aspartate 1-decarboxylase [Planctomycetes bacterium RBG_13_44_8b]